MFAFAMFDRVEQTLTLVRDAFGIKPMFYCQDDKGICFASEVPALLELLAQKPELNLQRAYDYLVSGSYDHSAQTFYEGIHHLLPGHWLRHNLRSGTLAEPQRWWWPSIEERTNLSFEDASEQLRGMFLDSVRLHLRSDVPLGAALSGGVDSSAVVCAIRHLEPDIPINTFTYVARGSSVDEERWADIINQHVGDIAHKVVVQPNELADDLNDMILAQGEPFGSTSIYAQYRVFKSARDAGITVTLDGQGADELLAGYWGYPFARMRSLLDTNSWLKALQFARHWQHRHQRPFKEVLRPLAASYVPSSIRSILRKNSRTVTPDCFNFEDFSELVKYDEKSGWSGVLNSSRGRSLIAVLRASVTGQRGLVHLLRHEDRNAMHWSLESRVPFLTNDLAEFLFSLPECYLLSEQGETKYIFRHAMRGIVPDAILDRQDKVGFETPEHQWLQALGPRVFEWLESAENIPVLNAEKVRSHVKTTLQDGSCFTWQTWRLLNFCRWYQLFF